MSPFILITGTEVLLLCVVPRRLVPACWLGSRAGAASAPWSTRQQSMAEGAGGQKIFQSERWDSGLQTCILLSVCVLNVKCSVVHYIFRSFKLESPRSWSSPF